MKFVSKSNLILCCALLLSVMLSVVFASSLDIGDIGIHSDQLESYDLIESIEDRFSNTFILKLKDKHLHIEQVTGIDVKSATDLKDDMVLTIEALYDNYLSAYPGEVSNEIVCNEKYKPVFYKKEIAGSLYHYYLLYSTERFGLGACTEDLVKYKHLIGWLYCPGSKEHYTIKYFVSKLSDDKELEDFFLNLKCR